MPCIVCDGIIIRTPARFAPFIQQRAGVREHTTTDNCVRCGFRYATDRYTDEQIAAIYDGYRDERYHAERLALEPETYPRWLNVPDVRPYRVEALIEPWVTPRTVLDIGSQGGVNTPFRETAEVTAWELGQPEPQGRWDLVSLQHVLEHVPDPAGLAARARLLGDWVYAEVPVEPDRDVWHEHCQQFQGDSLTWTVGHVVGTGVLDTPVGTVRWAVGRGMAGRAA